MDALKTLGLTVLGSGLAYFVGLIVVAFSLVIWGRIAFSRHGKTDTPKSRVKAMAYCLIAGIIIGFCWAQDAQKAFEEKSGFAMTRSEKTEDRIITMGMAASLIYLLFVHAPKIFASEAEKFHLKKEGLKEGMNRDQLSKL